MNGNLWCLFFLFFQMINISLYLLIFTGCSCQYLVFLLCMHCFCLDISFGKTYKSMINNLLSLAKMGPFKHLRISLCIAKKNSTRVHSFKKKKKKEKSVLEDGRVPLSRIQFCFSIFRSVHIV